MLLKVWARLVVGVGMLAGGAWAQAFSDASLNGKWFIREVFVASGAAGSINEAQSLSATVQFDGAGNYSFAGQSVNGTGTYHVSANATVTLTNPIRATATLVGHMSPAALAVSSTEEGGGVYDLLIAVPAPTATLTPASLNGGWWVASVDFRNGLAGQARSSLFRVTASNGVFADTTVRGQSAVLGGQPVTQGLTGGSYTLGADGLGTATFPLSGLTDATALISGTKQMAVSADGNLLLMGSTSAGGHDLVVGVRALSNTASNASWNGLFFGGGIQLDSGELNAYAGSANATGDGVVLLSRRVRTPDGPTYFSGVNRYALASDGSGTLESASMALGAGGDAFVGSGAGLTNSDHYDLQFGFRAAPVAAGQGVFLHPYGVVNAASFAPPGNPIAPGELVTVFGSGLAAQTATASSTPFPVTLGDVQVLVNERASPLYVVSPNQVSFLVPQATGIGTASVVLVNHGTRSNAVEAPVALTSPGIFAVPPVGFGPGAILKADYSLVAAANPARRGESVQVFLTGLGSVSPAVADGAPGQFNPFNVVTGTVNVYIGGVKAVVTYKGLAPGLAGLYQVNVVIPASAPAGNSVPIGIETADAFQDSVDIAIAP